MNLTRCQSKKYAVRQSSRCCCYYRPTPAIMFRTKPQSLAFLALWISSLVSQRTIRQLCFVETAALAICTHKRVATESRPNKRPASLAEEWNSMLPRTSACSAGNRIVETTKLQRKLKLACTPLMRYKYDGKQPCFRQHEHRSNVLPLSRE
jgi:hypothetical protein